MFGALINVRSLSTRSTIFRPGGRVRLALAGAITAAVVLAQPSLAAALPGGTFRAPVLGLGSFGASAAAGGWQVDRHPRTAVDITNGGRADFVGSPTAAS